MSTPENATTQPAPTGSSKPTNDLMSLLGAGPAKKPKFSAGQSRAAVPLTRNGNTAGAGKAQPERKSAPAATRQEQPDRAPEAVPAEDAEPSEQLVAPEATEATATILEPAPARRGVEHETGPDIRPAALTETPRARATSAELAVACSDAWRDELRSEAKEMTRAANYVASMLQQNKSFADIQAASTRLNEQARGFVAAVTENAAASALVAERVSALQKASGGLMRAADKATSPEDALSFAQSKPQAASNVFLTGSLEKAAEREKARSSDGVEAAPAQTTSSTTDTTGAQPVLDATRDLVLEANRQSPEKRRVQPVVASGADSVQAEPETGTAKETSPDTTAAVEQPEAPAPVHSTTARATAVPGERDKAPAQPVQSGLKLHTERAGDRGAHSATRDAAEDRLSIESFLEEPPARTRRGQSTQPQQPAKSAHPTSTPEEAPYSTVETLLQEPRATPVTQEVAPAPSRGDAETNTVQAATSERQTLGVVLREHMVERGFDNEAQRLAPTVAGTVRDNGRFRPKEQSVVVLHKEGDRLATATTQRSLPVVAMRGDSVLHAKTLEHIAEHGLDDAIVRALRNAAPQATGSLTNLEVADSVGAGFLERAGEEGVPRELFEQLREVSVETQRQLSEKTDKTLAQQFALEQVSKQWGDERRSVDDVLRVAPAAAVQKIEQVAEEQRANAVAHHPAELDTPEPQRGSAQKGEPARTFRFGGK